MPQLENYRVSMRIVANTSTLIKAKSREEAEEMATARVKETLTKAIHEESGGTDRLIIPEMEMTDTFESSDTGDSLSPAT